MPANLNPQYYEVEEKLKSATTPEERVSILEEMLAVIPKHKGTEKLQAMLKTKLAKQKNACNKKSSTAKHGPSHKVKKSGAGQVAVIGPPNAGKTMLIESLTDHSLHVDISPFTTHEPLPVMLKYENIQIQLVDTPPVTPDYMEFWYPDIIRAADAVLIVADLTAISPTPLETVRTIFNILKAKKLDFVRDNVQKPPERGWSFKKTIVVGNKFDEPEGDKNFTQFCASLNSDYKVVKSSAMTGEGLDELSHNIFEMLNIIRIYSKIPGKKAEMNAPFTLPRGSDVMDMARTVHKDFAHNLKFARIWSKESDTYDGQRVNKSHLLEDEDILELHM
jgi:uncharacterized protein